MAEEDLKLNGGAEDQKLIPAEDLATLSIQFLDPDGTRCNDDEIKQLTVTLAEVGCEDERPCAHVFSKVPEAPFRVRAKRWVVIRASGETKDAKVEFPQTAVYVGCGETSVQMYAQKALSPILSKDRLTFAVRALWCEKKAGRHDRTRTAEIARAVAEFVPEPVPNPNQTVQPKEVHVPGTVHGDTAVFLASHAGMYRLHVELKEKCARACPPMPHMVQIGGMVELEYPVYFERPGRTVTVLFVDDCGRHVRPMDVYREGEFSALKVSSEGGTTLADIEIGEMRFLSDSQILNPDRIHVDERMTQAHFIQVRPKVAPRRALPAGPVDEFIFEFGKLPAKAKASVEVFDLSGQHITTLTADSTGQFRHPANPNDEYEFVGIIDGQPVERVRLKSS